MEPGEFHWTNGWYFKRLDDGSVRIRKQDSNVPNGQNIAVCVIPMAEWASIVSFVSKGGETGDRFNRALQFHDN
jgi:hypothetical protein